MTTETPPTTTNPPSPAAAPDIFTNVHKGIRRALFHVCTLLGRADGDEARTREAREELKQVLHFVQFHGDNEDLLILPLLSQRVPLVAAQMQTAHARLHPMLDALNAQADTASTEALHQELAAFISVYLAHMHQEEHELQPLIRAAISAEELAQQGRGSVARATPDEQRMMLGWMLPALPQAVSRAFLQKLPPLLAADLAALMDGSSAD